MKTVGFKGYSVFFNFLLSSTDINRGFKLSTSLFSHVNLNSKGAKGHPSLKRFTFKHGRRRYGVQYFKTAFETKVSVKHRPDLPVYIKNQLNINLLTANYQVVPGLAILFCVVYITWASRCMRHLLPSSQVIYHILLLSATEEMLVSYSVNSSSYSP